MLPTLKDILDTLDEIAPFILAEEWDNSGLQVGSLSHEIKKIYVALDPTIETLKNASNTGAQLLLTHHPLIYKPLLNINYEKYPGEIIYFASKAEISIIAAHTNLDICIGGINDILANILNLEGIKALEEHNGNSESIGIGRIGTLQKPLELSKVIEILKNCLGVNNIMVSGKNDKIIKRIAVVGGSGGDTISTAAQKGADLLVTGDIKYHQAMEAQNSGLSLIDGGHFHTERTALKVFSGIFKDALASKGWDVMLEFHGNEKNPMRFV